MKIKVCVILFWGLPQECYGVIPCSDLRNHTCQITEVPYGRNAKNQTEVICMLGKSLITVLLLQPKYFKTLFMN